MLVVHSGFTLRDIFRPGIETQQVLAVLEFPARTTHGTCLNFSPYTGEICFVNPIFLRLGFK